MTSAVMRLLSVTVAIFFIAVARYSKLNEFTSSEKEYIGNFLCCFVSAHRRILGMASVVCVLVKYVYLVSHSTN